MASVSEQILSYLSTAGTGNWVKAVDIREKYGIKPDSASQSAKRLEKNGTIEIKRETEKRADGKATRVTYYRLKPHSKAHTSKQAMAESLAFMSRGADYQVDTEKDQVDTQQEHQVDTPAYQVDTTPWKKPEKPAPVKPVTPSTTSIRNRFASHIGRSEIINRLDNSNSSTAKDLKFYVNEQKGKHKGANLRRYRRIMDLTIEFLKEENLL